MVIETKGGGDLAFLVGGKYVRSYNQADPLTDKEAMYRTPYSDRLFAHDILTPEQHVELIARYRDTSLPIHEREGARIELMGSFFKYLRERADHYSQVYGVHDTPSIADLFQEAATVFWDKVVPKWDSAKSNLVNYSKLWVRQAIERYAFVHAHAYKRETYLKDWHHRFNVAEMEFFKEKGYLPTREELADILDMTVEDIERIEFTKVPNTSLHTTTSKEGYEYDECGIDTLEDMDWVDQLDRLVREEEKAELPDALAELPGRWRQILMTRYFRDDGKLVPFGEIAKGYDVSWQRIEQIEKQAFRRIREHFEAVYSE